MRLWSVNPRYLDARGLVALWREGLLAQAVLRGETRGYAHHPQLERFLAQRVPVAAIAAYLAHVRAEATRRGYSFDAAKIGPRRQRTSIPVTRGQLDYEWKHLQAKLVVRDPAQLATIRAIARPHPHPSFRVVAGDIAPWEKL